MDLSQASVNDLAKCLGITARRVQQLTAEGVIPKTDRGSYDLAAAVPAFIAHLRDRASGGLGDQKRLIKAKARLAEIEVEKAEGELVSLSAVGDVWSEAIVNARNRLRGIPSKAAPLVAVETRPEECQAILLTLVDEALTELADNPDAGLG